MTAALRMIWRMAEQVDDEAGDCELKGLRGVAVREALLGPRQGDTLPATDASYMTMLQNAERLAGR